MGSCHKKRQPLILIEHNLISPYIKLGTVVKRIKLYNELIANVI